MWGCSIVKLIKHQNSTTEMNTKMMSREEDEEKLSWDALKRSIQGIINKVSPSNISHVIPELFSENLIRGKGLLCRSLLKSQAASPFFTDVFAAVAAVVNTKIPEVGLLLLSRLILLLKRAYKRNDKVQLKAAVKFLAHLVNQQVADVLPALELLTLLLDHPTDDSIVVAVEFVEECGLMIQELCPKVLDTIFNRFRDILYEGEIDKRVQFMIEGVFAVRKRGFRGYPAVRPELDLVRPDDVITHEVSLDDTNLDDQACLDVFKPDPDFLENERRYEEFRKSVLGEEDEETKSSSEPEDGEEEEEGRMKIQDATGTELVNLRRTIYLAIKSCVDFEEAGHKLMKIRLDAGQQMEICIMLLEYCGQKETYQRFFGLLGARLCTLNKVYQQGFEECFRQQYAMVHRFETNKIRNLAIFFAHLFAVDALPWNLLSYIRLTEEDTNSSSRIFLKTLFQELAGHLELPTFYERFTDPTMQGCFEGIFPKDSARNARFSINYFNSIGLAVMTDHLREYLNTINQKKLRPSPSAGHDNQRHCKRRKCTSNASLR